MRINSITICIIHGSWVLSQYHSTKLYWSWFWCCLYCDKCTAWIRICQWQQMSDIFFRYSLVLWWWRFYQTKIWVYYTWYSILMWLVVWDTNFCFYKTLPLCTLMWCVLFPCTWLVASYTHCENWPRKVEWFLVVSFLLPRSQELRVVHFTH